jgi:CRP-like cAMP-binding protein
VSVDAPRLHGAAYVDLARSELLDGIDPVARRASVAILTAGPALRLPAGGNAPLRIGSAGFAVVAAGEVEVVATPADDREVVIALARGGELVTAPADPGGQALSVGVRAVRDSVVCRVEQEQLRALARAPQVILNILAAVAARADEAQCAAIRLAHRRVEDRVLLALRALAAREGKVTREGVRLPSIRHRDLARLANVTRPGATQAISTLCAHGDLMRAEGGDFVLPATIAEGNGNGRAPAATA